jgi:hypothetical protein
MILFQQLKEDLSNEDQHHQTELAVVQDVQSQKIATMKKRHKNELNALEDRIQELQLHLDQGKISIKYI